MSNEVGYYNDCTIIGAGLGKKGDVPVMLFDVKLASGGTVEVEQRLFSDNPITKEIAENICKYLGVAFSKDGMKNLPSTVGKDVTLKMKIGTGNNGQTYENWNFAIRPPTTKVEENEIDSLLADVFDDDIPF